VIGTPFNEIALISLPCRPLSSKGQISRVPLFRLSTSLQVERLRGSVTVSSILWYLCLLIPLLTTATLISPLLSD
jgi:hypothetical protein